jgi:hypothetical protein
MNEDPNTTREVHFKLDSDSDQVSDSSSSDSSDSSDISKDKSLKKQSKKTKKPSLNTTAPSGVNTSSVT